MDKLGYKRLRTTVALIAHSKALEDEHDAALTEAVHRVLAVNYQLEALDAKTVEYVSSIDEAFAKKAAREFEFTPALGSIRDHGEHVAVCALCGKGDSKGDGTNKDLLRYDFKLANVAGGADLWVGKTCIVAFGLRVAGAATSAEALKILERTMRQHMRWWETQRFQAAHPDHANIPDHAQEVARTCMSWAQLVRDGYAQISQAEAMRVQRELPRLAKQMRRANGFYQRTGRLTALKTEHWLACKGVLTTCREAMKQGREAAQSSRQ